MISGDWCWILARVHEVSLVPALGRAERVMGIRAGTGGTWSI